MPIQQMLLGASRTKVIGALTPVTVSHGVLAPQSASAQYTVYGPTTFPGQVNKNAAATASPNVLPETWLVEGVAADYDVRFREVSRSHLNLIVTGDLDTWLNMSTARAVAVPASNATNGGVGIDYVLEMVVEFSEAGQGAVIGSVPVTLTARRD